MKAEKSIQGLQQLINTRRNSSLNPAAKGHLLHRKCTRAHHIVRKFAHNHMHLLNLSISNWDLHVGFKPDSNDYWDSGFPEYDTALWQKLAVDALKYYHQKQGVELELNGEISAFPLHYGDGVGFHLSFQANDSIGSPKKIFAEVFQSNKNGECRVVFCDIMDPNDPDLLKGCRFCSPLVLHPKGMKFFKDPSDASV